MTPPSPHNESNPMPPPPPDPADAPPGAERAPAPIPAEADALSAPDPAAMLAVGFSTPAPEFTSQPGRGDASGVSNSDAATIQLSPPATDVPPAEQLAAEFPQLELLGLIGRGGMGVVYKARQIALDRIVAVKIIGDRVARHPQFAERFHREARAMARLSHPNILVVHEFGRTSAGRYFFVMEFVDGTNLRQVLRAGRMAPAEALQIVPQVCDALQYAHEVGIVHRDIKPENILLDRKGRVKIADFGLAKLRDATGGVGAGGVGVGGDPADGEARGLTQSDMAIGTPHYMAPEQLERPLEVDHRADVYALGVVLYEMLTGELPLGRFAPPSRKVQVDVRVDEVVLRALERDPEARYQQVSEVRSGIEQAIAPPGPGRVAGSAGAGFAGATAGFGAAGMSPSPVGGVSPPGVSVAPPPQPPPLPPPERTSKKALWSLPLQLFPFFFLPIALFSVRSAAVVASHRGEAYPSARVAAIGMIPGVLCPLLIGLLGITLAIGGLGDIRRSGGRLGGAAAGAAGLVFLPSVLFGILFGALSRFAFAVLIATGAPGSNFLSALGNPSYSRADQESFVFLLAGVFASGCFGVWLGRMAYRHATPWVPRGAQALAQDIGGGGGAAGSHGSPQTTVLAVASVALLMAGLAPRSNIIPGIARFEVGLISPWITQSTVLRGSSAAILESPWEFRPLSWGMLLLLLAIACHFLHISTATRLLTPEAARRNLRSTRWIAAIAAIVIAMLAVVKFEEGPKLAEQAAAAVGTAASPHVGTRPSMAAELLCLARNGAELKRIPLQGMYAFSPGGKGYSTSHAFSIDAQSEVTASARFLGTNFEGRPGDRYDVALKGSGPPESSTTEVGFSFTGIPRPVIRTDDLVLVLVPAGMAVADLPKYILDSLNGEGTSPGGSAAAAQGSTRPAITPKTPVQFVFVAPDKAAYVLPLPRRLLPTKSFDRENSTTARFVSARGESVVVRLRFDGRVTTGNPHDAYFAEIELKTLTGMSSSTATFKLGELIWTDALRSNRGVLHAITPGTDLAKHLKAPWVLEIPKELPPPDPPEINSPLHPDPECVIEFPGGRQLAIPAPNVLAESLFADDGSPTPNVAAWRLEYGGSSYSGALRFAGLREENRRIVDLYDIKLHESNRNGGSSMGMLTGYQGDSGTGKVSNGGIRLFLRPRTVPPLQTSLPPDSENALPPDADEATTLTLVTASATTRLEAVAPLYPAITVLFWHGRNGNARPPRMLTVSAPGEVLRDSFVDEDGEVRIFMIYRGRRVNVHTGFAEDEYWIGELRTLNDGAVTQRSCVIRVRGLDDYGTDSGRLRNKTESAKKSQWRLILRPASSLRKAPPTPAAGAVATPSP